MEILDWHDALPGSFHVGEFTVHLPMMDLYIRKMKICRSKKGHLFVSYPSHCTGSDALGKKTFTKTVEIGSKRVKEFEEKVLELCKPFLGE